MSTMTLKEKAEAVLDAVAEAIVISPEATTFWGLMAFHASEVLSGESDELSEAMVQTTYDDLPELLARDW